MCQKDNFLPNEFTTHYPDDHFMLLVVVQSTKNGGAAFRAYEPCDNNINEEFLFKKKNILSMAQDLNTL